MLPSNGPFQWFQSICDCPLFYGPFGKRQATLSENCIGPSFVPSLIDLTYCPASVWPFTMCLALEVPL